MRLTDKTIAALALPKGKAEAIFYDDDLPGFGYRLRAGGSARWVYTYKIGTQHRRITLGSTTTLSASRARQTAAALQAKVRLGADPAAAKAEGRVHAGETVNAALHTYLAHQRTHIKPLSYRQLERHLVKHCRALHGQQLAKVDRRTVAARLAIVANKSGPIEANRVRSSLAAFFAWAIREGLVDANPVVGTSRRPEHSRDRVLSNDELRAIWAATDQSVAGDYSAVVRLLMLTGARANEIASLRWSEVFGDRINLPAERTKNSRAHIIPLSATAEQILHAVPKRLDRDLVFGRHHDSPLSGWSVLKESLDKRIAKSGAKVKPWVHHDLRRTCATRMGEIGVQPHIIEAVLNHVSGHKHGVAGIYNRSTYEPEKRQALTMWAEHLAAIVEGRDPKVVVLPRGA
jgi:integrase